MRRARSNCNFSDIETNECGKGILKIWGGKGGSTFQAYKPT